MNDKMNNLFSELYWNTDNNEVMEEFAKLIMEFGEWNQSHCLCYMIDLSKYNKTFAQNGGHIYFVYDDMSGNDWQLRNASYFVKYIQEIFNEIEDEEVQKDIEYIFYDKLMELMK